MNMSDYRTALGSFMTGVTVVAAFDEAGAPWGLTANSFTSVSLDPALILVCVDRKGRTWPTFEASHSFSVNILAAEQEAMARHFAGPDPNRFASVPWTREEGGAPLLHDTAAWLDCRVSERIPAGDHVILLGEVARFGHAPRTPLGYCRGSFVEAHPARSSAA